MASLCYRLGSASRDAKRQDSKREKFRESKKVVHHAPVTESVEEGGDVNKENYAEVPGNPACSVTVTGGSFVNVIK